MRPQRKFSSHNDLVIVCEGSTTEYNYFCEIRDFIRDKKFPCPYTNILIIPGETDDNEQTGRQLKSFCGSKKELRYYLKSEQNEEDYNNYCSQPVRYVREAELFLNDPAKPYDEAWAVYDWDVKADKPDEKKHNKVPEILDRNDGRLNVAFSSYSFEEWLLMHFEKNNYVFTASDCSDDKDVSYDCGTHPSTYQGNDCHGTVCIAGQLREMNYIPDYSKEDKELFSKYTYTGGVICEDAFYNAAWLRSRSQRFSSDAYTDVDELVNRLIGENKRIFWYKSTDIIPLGRTTVNISKSENGVLTIQNVGKVTAILKFNNITITSDPKVSGASLAANLHPEILPADDIKEITLTHDGDYLRIVEDTKILIVELFR